jgi:hypothetical protein
MELYIFLDESGNFDFSNNQGATKWLMLTSLSTTDPQEALLEYYTAKYELIRSGYDVSYFHATEDSQIVRNRFFTVISGLSIARVDGLAIRKNRLNPLWRAQKEFYPRMLKYLLQYVFHPFGMDANRFDHILIFLAKMQLPKGHKSPIIAGIKNFLKQNLVEIPFSVSLHSSESNPYLQIVDYCSWALYVNRERCESRPLNRISNLINSDFDIFEYGDREWY